VDCATEFRHAQHDQQHRHEQQRQFDGSHAARLTLAGAPATLLLRGPRAQVMAPLERALQLAVIAHAAETAGAAWRAFEITSDYLRTRKQFGTTLATFQALRHRIADVKMQLELGRSMSYYATLKLGEAPVTRCALRLPGGAIGMAWVMGRDMRHAEYAARVDAMLQEPSVQHALHEQVIAPIAHRQQEARELASRKAAATTVSFYTLARGEDQP
jgi:phosphonate C-P lyase system protein PhnG